MLKAIYLRQHKLGAWPAEMRGSKWHEIERLSRSCRLAQDVSAASLLSARGHGRDTFLAVSDPAWGVFQWLMSRYRRI